MKWVLLSLALLLLRGERFRGINLRASANSVVGVEPTRSIGPEDFLGPKRLHGDSGTPSISCRLGQKIQSFARRLRWQSSRSRTQEVPRGFLRATNTKHQGLGYNV